MQQVTHKRIHLIGIGGIGMSAIAKLLITNDCVISGSNLSENDQVESLRSRGVKIYIGHADTNIGSDVEAVIHTSAVNESNVEMKKARTLNIPVYDYHEYLGLISKQYKTIAIAGTHGKSTTTALVASILVEAGFDPTVVVGSKIPEFDDNFRAGKSKYLVVEADEFNFGMLHLRPQVILLNNIEADHLDCYGSLENIVSSFKKFITNATNLECLIFNSDDKNVVEVVNDCQIHKISVGVSLGNVKYSYSQDNKVCVGGERYEHQLWGEYNDANLAMAITLANYLKVESNKIKNAVKNFTGIWRRFEVLTNNAFNKKVTLVSDYAHHPTALAGIIKAAQSRYVNRRVWTIFQPHHCDRVSNFFGDFVEALKLANHPVIIKTYDVPGREADGDRNKTAQDIVAEIKNCVYLDDVSLVNEFIKSEAKENDVFLAIGAGTIDEIVRQLI